MSHTKSPVDNPPSQRTPTMEVKRGATRTVLLIGRLALKFPRCTEWRTFLLGLLANMQERDFSTLQFVPLCPVLFALPGGFLVVMPRVRSLTWEEFDETHRPECWDLATNPEHPFRCEHKQCSFGWLHGKIVVVDYGN